MSIASELYNKNNQGQSDKTLNTKSNESSIASTLYKEKNGSSDNINLKSQSTQYGFASNPNYDLSDENTETQLNTDLDDVVNKFKQSWDETQKSYYLAKRNDAQNVLDKNVDEIKKLNYLIQRNPSNKLEYEQKLRDIDEQNTSSINKLSSAQEGIDTNEEEIANEYVSKIYKLKEALTNAKGANAGFIEAMHYTAPSGLGSMGSMMAEQMIATFGRQGMKKIAAAAITGAAEGLVGGPAAEFTVPLISATATISQIALLWNARNSESMSESGDAAETAKAKLTELWYKKNNPNGDPEGLQPSEEDLRQIRMQSMKGIDELYKSNMMLLVQDAGEMLIGSSLFKGSSISKGLGRAGEYNRYSRAAKALAIGYEKTAGEKFEEGYQYALGQRQLDKSLNLKQYEDKDFISNILTDAVDVFSSINFGLPYHENTNLGGKYSENKEFQSASEIGGLLGLLGGAATAGVKITKDIRTYLETSSDLKNKGIANVDNKVFKLKTQLYLKNFENDTVHFLLEGVRNLRDTKDEKGVPLMSDSQANEEIKNIIEAYGKYKQVSEHLANVDPDGALGVFKSKDQRVMLTAAKLNLLHASIELSKHNKDENVLESKLNIANLISHQTKIVEAIKEAKTDVKSSKVYGLDYRLKVAENKLADLKSKKESILTTEGIKESELPETASIEDSNLNKERLISELDQAQTKYDYDQLLKIKDNSTLKKWFNEEVKSKAKLKKDLTGETTENSEDKVVSETDKIEASRKAALAKIPKLDPEETKLRQDKINQEHDALISNLKKNNGLAPFTADPKTPALKPNEGIISNNTSEEWRISQAKKAIKQSILDTFKPLEDEINAELKQSRLNLAKEVKRQLEAKYKEGITEEAFSRLKEEAVERFNKLVASEDKKHAALKQAQARIQKQSDLESVLNSIPLLSELSPLEEVIFNGRTGFVFNTSRYNYDTFKDEEFYAFQDKVTGEVLEIPSDSKLGNSAPIYNYFIKQIPSSEQEVVNQTINSIDDIITIDNKAGYKITIHGKEYFNNYSNPLSAINKDKEGNVISVNLETKDGKKRTFTKYAQEIAYAILLQTHNKLEDENIRVREEVKRRLTEKITEEDIKRKESVINEADREHSRKIEEAVKAMNDSIARAKTIIQRKIEESVKEVEVATPVIVIPTKTAEEIAQEKLKEEQSKLFADAKLSKSSKELLTFAAKLKGTEYSSELNTLYEELLKKEKESTPKPEESEATTDSDNIDLVNQRVKHDDNVSRLPENPFKTNGGTDNGLKESEDIYFRTSENIELDEHKLQVVTKLSNPDLYERILTQDPIARAHEDKVPGYKGVWTVLVDKNENLVEVNGKLVQATIETSQRVRDGKIEVGRHMTAENAKIAEDKAIVDLDQLRSDAVNLAPGEVRFLAINGKSKGLVSEDNENGKEIHSAFEEKVAGHRPSFNVLGRIFKENKAYEAIKLAVVTIGDTIAGVPILKGKLYTAAENGRIFDLVPRIINEEEYMLIYDLLHKHMNKIDEQEGFNAIDEIKKIISFKDSKTSPEFQIYINKDNELVLGNQRPMDRAVFNKSAEEVITFLSNKRINANTKYISGTSFAEPSITGTGKKISYQEYLLSGDKPRFGTDLKSERESGGRRFIQTYFTYDNKLTKSSKALAKTSDPAPVVTPTTTTTKKAIPKRSTGKPLTRLTSVSKSLSKLTESEKLWFKEKFPNIPIEVFIGLIEGKALGQFLSSGKVLLSDKATEGTLYHEAFHVVTQLYLTKAEIDALYAEASLKHPGKSRIELEEILAEDFVDYKNTGKILGSSPKRNTLFRKILNAIKDFFNISAKDIKTVYDRLDSGFYTKSKLVNNREFSSLNKDEETKRVTKEKGTKFIKDVLDSLDIIFFNNIRDLGRTEISILNNMDEFINNTHDILAEKYQLLDDVKDAKLIEDHLYIFENWDTIVKIWSKRLDSEGIYLKIEEKPEEVVNEDGESKEDKLDNNASKADQYSEGNLTSTLESVSNPIRMLLKSLRRLNKDGSVYKNDLGYSVPVDFISTYNYLLKNVAGTGSYYSDLYNKIESLVKFKPEFAELLERLGKPNAELDEEHFNFQTKFLQDFNKNRTNSLITTYDTEGNIRVVDTNRLNESEKVKTIWEANLTLHTKANSEGRLIVDKDIINIKKPIDFLAKLGITFDDNTIDVINSKNFNHSKLDATVAAIKTYISYHKGDLTDIYTQVKDNYKDTDEVKAKKAADKVISIIGGRLNYLLELEAQNTSLVNELSYISADGKTEYSVGDNNALSITTNLINNAETKTDLFKKAPHLNTVGAEGSLWIDELFDSKTGLRNKNIQVKLELHNGINTSAESNLDISFPSRKGKKGDLFTQQIASILNGKSSYIVSADKSQEYILSLNYYNGNESLPISIESFKKGFNNVKLKQIFEGYFRSEFKRIALFELDGLGSNVDIYNNNGGKWTIFQGMLSTDNKSILKDLINNFKVDKQSYAQAEESLNNILETLVPMILDDLVRKGNGKDINDGFFEKYYSETKNALEEQKIGDLAHKSLLSIEEETSNQINNPLGFPKDLTNKYTKEQLIRAVIVTDLINSIEQVKLFTGDMAFYKDLVKRTAMFAGTKQLPRLGEEIDQHLNSKHPRKDGKQADGKENTIVFADVTTQKSGLEDWISAYVEANKSNLTKEEKEEVAYNTIGFVKNNKGEYVGDSAYGKADEGDAMGWGSMDFYKELSKRLGTTWTAKHDIAYNIIQSQVFDKEGNLIEGELLSQDQIVLFTTLKLQYAGPIEHDSVKGLFVPGGYKFTVMPLIPQMIAGKNLSKILLRMQEKQAGIALFKSASKFGTILNKDGKPNKFYSKGNNGDINSGNIESQSISYQYLGLQVKPSDPHLKGIFSTQFRKTIWINAFNGGKESFTGAKVLLDRFNSLINNRVVNDKLNLIKSLGINPESKKIEDVTALVELLTESSESRKLTDNIIDSLDIEVVDGKKQLKYNISSMVNKSKIDSILMSLINNRLIKQKFNGDAYVLAAPSGMENIGVRDFKSDSSLRGYTRDKKTGKTLPAQVMVPLSDSYKPLLDTYGSLKLINEAIKRGEIDSRLLELVGCRIPGQGMNSNEYLTIKEFLPKDSSTTMIAHPDIVSKAGSDYDNDKLYTYRFSFDKNGDYNTNSNDNQILEVIKDVISHEYNFLSLITPNSTKSIDPIVNDIKYTRYKNLKILANKKAVLDGKKEESVMSLDGYIESQKNLSKNITYTELLKLHKKVAARYKLWLAKDEVGPSAIANAYGPLSQISGLTANKTYINDKKEVVAVTINLPHNKTTSGKLDLGGLKDALGINNISEINNQLINIIVDAAKDEEPMVAFLNMTMETLPVYLYLNKMGVPFEYVANLIAQPIITEYLEADSINKAVFLKATNNHLPFGVKNIIRDKYKTSYPVANTELTLEQLKNSQDISIERGAVYNALQLQVLRDFLAYKEQAQLFGEAVRLTNSDSAGVGQNVWESRLKQKDFQKVTNNNFINGVDKIIEDTFVGAFNQDQFAIDTYSPLYDTQSDKIVDLIMSIGDDIEAKARAAFKTFTRKDKLKAINTIENDFINYIVQNYGYSNVLLTKNRLFKGDKSIAKQLLALKNKRSDEKTSAEKKLTDNILIKELFPLIDAAKKGTNYDNIKTYSKKLDTFRSNQLTEAFRELADISNELLEEKLKANGKLEENDKNLAKDLMHLGILQSGLNNSPITYLGIIPFEYYNDLVKASFREFNKKNGAEYLGHFTTLFNLNRANKLGLGMYGKDFSLTNIKDYNNSLNKSNESGIFVNPKKDDFNPNDLTPCS